MKVLGEGDVISDAAQQDIARNDESESEDDDFVSTVSSIDVGPGWDINFQDWYRPVVEFRKTGQVVTPTVPAEFTIWVIRRAPRRIDHPHSDPPRPEGLGYGERNGKISRCIVKKDVDKTLEVLDEVHRHFSDSITTLHTIGVAWWPHRMYDIFRFYRNCIQCQILGPLRPSQGLLPILFLQPIDCSSIYWSVQSDLRLRHTISLGLR